MHAFDNTGKDVRIDPEFMFSNHKNIYKPGLERKQRKLLRKIPFINAFLEPDEKVLLVTTCVSPTSLWEQMTSGWIFVYVNRALLVVTNKGILHIPTKTNYNYRQSIAKFRYEDCKQLRIRGSNLFVQYANGRKERFLFLPRAQRKKLKSHFESLQSAFGETEKQAGRMHLCPRCTSLLSPNVYQCAICRLEFKDMATAGKLSIFIPGGGYFYTGHPLIGFGDLVVEIWLLAGLVIWIDGLIGGQAEAVAGVSFFGIFLGIEKLITIHHAKRYVLEYIPKEKVARIQPAVAGQKT